MENSVLETHSILAVSAMKQAAARTAATVDLAFLVDTGSTLKLDANRETNRDDLNGLEEPDEVFMLGWQTSIPISWNRLQPHMAAWALAYGLGSVATVDHADSSYTHTILGMTDTLNPLATVIQRYGNSVLKRRAMDMTVNNFTLALSEGWVTGSCELQGSGYWDANTSKETITAADDVTELTLAADIHGTTDPERLKNLQVVEAQLTTGEWVTVVPTGIDAVNKDTFTFAAPGATSTDITYRVIFVPDEPAWCTLPARTKESPLKVTDFLIRRNGLWDGTALTGGIPISADFKNFEYSLQNDQTYMSHPKALVGQLGTDDLHTEYEGRSGRTQTIKLGRQFRDMALHQHFLDNETINLHLIAQGPEFVVGVRSYILELFFPKLAVLQDPLEVDNKKLAEAGDLEVLHDETLGYSVYAKVITKLDAVVE
jgi:hypothetical protein